MSERDQKDGTEAPSVSETVETLLRMAAEWDRRAATLREAARILSDITSAMQADAITTTPPPPPPIAQASNPSAPARTLPPPAPRIPTSTLILEALEAKPGLQFDELAEIVIPQIESTAKNKKKLLRSTLDYLIKSKRKVFVYPNGGLYVTVQTVLEALDDLNKAVDGLNDKTRAD